MIEGIDHGIHQEVHGDKGSAAIRPRCRSLEFVPLADPNDARASARLAFRLLFQGQALAGARVHAELAPPAGSTAPVASEVISREGGTVDVALTSAGLWNVRTIHVVPAPKGVGADWEVHWATFVFEVK